jgi:hypothetical protein
MARRVAPRIEMDQASQDALLASSPDCDSLSATLLAGQRLIERGPHSDPVRIYESDPDHCGPLTRLYAKALQR